jgi:hypothetical protein
MVNAQPRFPMKYLDEVGHLGGLDKRTSVNLGIARVFIEPEGDLRFEGLDRTGKLWRVWLPPAGGIGGTDVWTADFDRNGRQDLLIAAYFPGNGHCIDEATVYTLMFDDLGRPVPWVAPSHSFAGFQRPPVTLLDANGDGRAELVTVSCEYSDPATGFGEDRQISGIYEARDARWHPLRNTPDRPYLAAVKRQLGRTTPGFVRWLQTDPVRWPDFMEGYDRPPTAQIQSLITREVGCGGIRLPIVDGRIVQLKDDPCDSLKHDQIVFSDGKPRRGWPSVVIDSSDGRNVFLSDPGPPLMNVLKMGYRFKILGNPASPDLLWADGARAMPERMSSRLRIQKPKRMQLIVQDQLASGPDMMDVTFNEGQRCFVLRSNGENSRQATESQSCPALTKLRNAGVAGGAIKVWESTAWQILPDSDVIRILRSNDGGEVGTVKFEPAPETRGGIAGAVAFGKDWLVEWHAGVRRSVVLHSGTGKPLTTEMALPIDGELFASRDSEGLYFLKWANGKPVEWIIVPASVEWSRAPE